MPGLIYKLFGAGRLPQAIRDEIEGESILFETEGIRVTVHRHGPVPCARDASGVSASLGGFAVTDRMLGMFARPRERDRRERAGEAGRRAL